MIPYDDLVSALSQWRARQGLPVSTMGGGGSGGAKAATSGSGPTKAPPPPVHQEEEVLEADEYEQPYEEHVEPTSIGGAPERPTETDMGQGGRDDW